MSLVYAGLFDLPWWGVVVAALALTHVTIAAVTIYLHRHQAHRALELGALPSHFFRFWLWLTTGMVTREWAAIHRKHHARCETSEDPHSPRVYGLAGVLFGGVFLYFKESRVAATLERYGHGTPDDWLERHVYTPLHMLGIALMLGLDLLAFGLLPGALVWLTQMLWIPFWAAGVINGLGHAWGYRSFANADASTNILPWGILIGGEELHNNHHAYATSAKLSRQWYEIDLGWLYIRFLELLGLARVKRVAPKLRLGAVRAAVDDRTLEAVVLHRCEVLAGYVKSLRRAAAAEMARLELDAGHNRVLRRWLALRSLGSAEQERLAMVLNESELLAKLFAMRADLEALWSRSNASREQLTEQLRLWIQRAEQSGIEQLREFSLRLRRCAV